MRCWFKAGFIAALCGFVLTASAADELDPLTQRTQPCQSCHGKEGVAARDGFYPRIAGKPAGYLYNQLINFREGRRHNAMMTYMVSRQSDAYLREIARYFADLHLPYAPPQAVSATPAQLALGDALVRQGDEARGIPACQSCHGARLTGVLPAVPGLVGLPHDYVVSQVGAWQTDARRALAPDCMATIARKLTGEDLSAIAAWLSAQVMPEDSTPAVAPPGAWPMACGGATP